MKTSGYHLYSYSAALLKMQTIMTYRSPRSSSAIYPSCRSDLPNLQWNYYLRNSSENKNANMDPGENRVCPIQDVKTKNGEELVWGGLSEPLPGILFEL